uniref:Uncharacterized protein n=1 Tax=Rousettus aegyptiacus TaxID=9407 RepID=A0A7J8JHT2_ROUAE|nr:hypothetical protein HJG63_010209 [Rousettus aegyptiacus]
MRTWGDEIPGGQAPGPVPFCVPQSRECRVSQETPSLLEDCPRLLTSPVVMIHRSEHGPAASSPLCPESDAALSPGFPRLPPARIVASSLALAFHPTRSRLSKKFLCLQGWWKACLSFESGRRVHVKRMWERRRHSTYTRPLDSWHFPGR